MIYTGSYFLQGIRPVSYTHLDVYKRQTENDPVKIYYSNLEPLCTEDGLDSMSANRIPFEYEELAEKYGYTFKPENISVEKTDFTLDLNILSGEDVVGSVKQTGQIQIVSENGKEFVD